MLPKTAASLQLITKMSLDNAPFCVLIHFVFLVMIIVYMLANPTVSLVWSEKQVWLIFAF